MITNPDMECQACEPVDDTRSTNVVDLETARIKRDYVGKRCWNCNEVVRSVGPSLDCEHCRKPLEPF